MPSLSLLQFLKFIKVIKIPYTLLMSSKHSRYVRKVHLQRSEDSFSEEVFFHKLLIIQIQKVLKTDKIYYSFIIYRSVI